MNVLSISNISIGNSSSYSYNYNITPQVGEKYLIKIKINSIGVSTNTNPVKIQPCDGSYFNITQKEYCVGNEITKILTIADGDNITNGTFTVWCRELSSGEFNADIIMIKYQEGMENWDIPYFDGMLSVKMPVLKTTGKNLFDKKNHGWDLKIGYIASDGQISSFYKHTIYTQILDVPKNIQIVSLASNLRPIIIYYDKNDVIVKQTTDGIIDASYERMRLSFRTVDNSEISEEILLNSNIQIEYGTVATSYEPFKSIILTVNDDVTLRSNGDVYDELNLLTGRLTQRIDENNEVLAQEVVKTVDLSVVNQDGEQTSLKAFEGTTHIQTNGQPIKPLVDIEVPVEAITQNLESFIEEE